MRKSTKSIHTTVCCGQINSGRWCQEHYETASRDAGVRAAQLRDAGYKVNVSSLGLQVTSLGLLGMTMITVDPGTNRDTCSLPTADWKLERI